MAFYRRRCTRPRAWPARHGPRARSTATCAPTAFLRRHVGRRPPQPRHRHHPGPEFDRPTAAASSGAVSPVNLLNPINRLRQSRPSRDCALSPDRRDLPALNRTPPCRCPTAPGAGRLHRSVVAAAPVPALIILIMAGSSVNSGRPRQKHRHQIASRGSTSRSAIPISSTARRTHDGRREIRRVFPSLATTSRSGRAPAPASRLLPVLRAPGAAKSLRRRSDLTTTSSSGSTRAHPCRRRCPRPPDARRGPAAPPSLRSRPDDDRGG